MAGRAMRSPEGLPSKLYIKRKEDGIFLCAALRIHTGALRGFSLKGGPNLWLKDIDPKLKEKEMLTKIQDLLLSYLTQEFLFRKHVSY